MEQNLEKYMLQCLELAEIAVENGNPPVGAILVFEDKIIGKGIEAGKSTGDITNHAEILAVKDALQNGYGASLYLSQLFTTHEPCIMCAYVIRHHKIPHIIYGIDVENVGSATSDFKILSTEKIPKWGKSPHITRDICQAKCLTLNEQFLNFLQNTEDSLKPTNA